ncbi:hypothetical protein NDU88_002022 [Pleurodeles waltl]|uniref:Uncharacterized protein n=1 Tax=Pleurodeles waltl TaxID=8319 RepID=A0AAV7TJG1_PLEWA|nr:hypothetical protein NDU88_002022 [Pleurodeles waltl]
MARALVCCCRSEARVLRPHLCRLSSPCQGDDAPYRCLRAADGGPGSAWRPSEGAGCNAGELRLVDVPTSERWSLLAWRGVDDALPRRQCRGLR